MDNTPPVHIPPRAVVSELAAYISLISERAYYAAWMHGVEHALWELAKTNEPACYGDTMVRASELALLRELSEEIGGWVYWHESESTDPVERYVGTGPKFVPMGQWLKKHAEHVAFCGLAGSDL